ncbi:MFS transporter [Massilia sp. GER05]|uniref:MFS transporter n=1 Tax=Massilia sp. GER05 TaxID=3394605 RepID=UPI003F86B761
MTDTTSSTSAPRGRHLAALALLAFSHLIISLDYTIVFVALPSIRTALGFTPQTLQWVVSAYIVPYGGLLLLGGRACDLFGRRSMLVAGFTLFGLASLAGGLAPGPGLLLAARAVQGVGAALLFPATLSLITVNFAEGRARHLALSVWAGVGGSGMALGALAGGLLTEMFGWSAIFLVNVPLAVAGVLAAFLVIAPDGARTGRRDVDAAGALAGTLGMTLLVYVLVRGPEHGWDAAPILAAGLAAVLLLAGFVAIERRARDPLLPPSLFAAPGLAPGLAVILMFSATFGSLLYFLAQYFQAVLRFPVWQAGLAYVPLYCVIIVMSSLGGHVAGRLGLRHGLLIGLVSGGVGMLLTAWAMAGASGYTGLLPGLLLYSAGMGMTFTVMFATATTGVPAHRQGVASGAASTCQQLGSAVGIALLVPLSQGGPDMAHALAAVHVTAALGVAAMIAIVVWRVQPRLPAGREITLDIEVHK